MLRLMWGMKVAGSIFHRGVTTITVRWMIKKLMEEWVPSIICPLTRKWIQERMSHGLTGEQASPFLVNGFLDDFFVFLAGTDEDIARGQQIVMEAFDFLGWELSKSKFLEEGTPDTDGIILGHGIDTQDCVRYITTVKIDRIRRVGTELMQESLWDEKKLSSFIGLVQSVRGDVIRRWRLGPLYRVLHSSFGKSKKCSPRSKVCLQRILSTLHERRSIFHIPTPWVFPEHPLEVGIPNADASGKFGLCGVLRRADALEYCVLQWKDDTKRAKVHIGVLEAFGILCTAATWAKEFYGRKVIFRSDSKETCSCLNKLNSQSAPMERVVDAWEDLLFEMNMEAIVIHVAGKANGAADAGSRFEPEKVVKALHDRLGEIGIEVSDIVKVPIPQRVGSILIAELEDQLVELKLEQDVTRNGLSNKDAKAAARKQQQGHAI